MATPFVPHSTVSMITPLSPIVLHGNAPDEGFYQKIRGAAKNSGLWSSPLLYDLHGNGPWIKMRYIPKIMALQTEQK
jgi:hypothetical protein